MGEVLRLEEPSTSSPERMNVLIQASSFEACQQIITQVMEESASATFTIPAKSAAGDYLAIGHYTRPAESLPEY